MNEICGGGVLASKVKYKFVYSRSQLPCPVRALAIMLLYLHRDVALVWMMVGQLSLAVGSIHFFRLVRFLAIWRTKAPVSDAIIFKP